MTESQAGGYQEEAIEPDMRIVDPHHHLYPPGGAHGHGYERFELDRDLSAGHNIVATVFIDSMACYREAGPPSLAPVGETEWVVTQRSNDAIMSGIIAHADLFLGTEVSEVLYAHQVAGGEFFKGIRHNVAWDRHPDTPNARRGAGEHALLEDSFQAGAAELDRAGLIFETWLYFNQLEELAAFAGTFPHLSIVLNHLGGPVVVGAYAGKREEVLAEWRRGIESLRPHTNVNIKIGGIGFRAFVEDELMAKPRQSDLLAAYWKPEIQYCIETLGTERCMFESNYPQDRPFCDYVTLWNVYKHVSSDFSPAERRELFEGTARRVYSLKR